MMYGWWPEACACASWKICKFAAISSAPTVMCCEGLQSAYVCESNEPGSMSPSGAVGAQQSVTARAPHAHAAVAHKTRAGFLEVTPSS